MNPWLPFPFPCRRWNEECLCEGHQGIFSTGKERQNIKYMGKYSSCSCQRNCILCQTSSGLLFFLGRIYLCETQRGEESTTSCRLTGRQLCPALSPSRKSGKSSSTRFLPDAGTLHSWQLLVLCAGTGNARGLGLE